MQLKEYLNVIRRTVTINAFIEQYFLKIVVIYLLASGIAPWVAVSLPVVSEFARIISRGFKFIVKLAIKVNYKKFHLFYLVALSFLCVSISQCSSVFLIYFLTLILGILTGINNSCITKINTSNEEYESYCFIEEEKSWVFGATLGLVISQIIYDISSSLYIIGFVILGILGFVINMNMPDLKETEDVMESFDDTPELSKKEKNNIILVTSLFAIMVSFWCIGLNAMSELVPLLTTKVGYLGGLCTGVELIFLFILNGKVLNKIKKQKKQLLAITIIALLDILYLLLIALFKFPIVLITVYIFMGISSTLGDPLWGTIISSYSENNRRKYTIINNVYFIIRGIFGFVSIIICRWCVINGIDSFVYLSIILASLIILFYFLTNSANKKVFGSSI